MNANPPPPSTEEQYQENDSCLFASIESLLAEPAHQSNPLREPLTRLLAYSEEQKRRMERLIKISDRYQNSLYEMSEALRGFSLHDQLTGLGNRRFLIDRLNEETERANRKNGPYSLAILDVDLFKLVNDRFGHGVGDEVLCQIARAIEEALREYYHCGRWGGEEFLILLPDTSLESALHVAERIRQNIQALSFDANDLKVTASLGMTLYLPEETFSTTITRADHALLNSKSLGRNRIEVA